MLNLDSEEAGSFIVGCAGGMTTFVNLPVRRGAVPDGATALGLTVGGLQGGHSGVDIHKFRGNALKLAARALDRISEHAPIRIHALRGGSARNAIARDARVVFSCPAPAAADCRAAFASAEAELRSELERFEPRLSLSLEPVRESQDDRPVDRAETQKIIALLMALPHGVIQMSADIPGFVETSTNLAMAELDETGLHVTTNQRSDVNSRRDEVNRRVEAVARLAGAGVEHTEGYLAWEPDMTSGLLRRSIETYAQLFGHPPQVKTIHAGLECGIIAGRFSEPLEMISIGPTIQNPHSPDERLHLPSVAHLWQFVVKLLESSL
jgi:dipeptidase D